MPSRKEKGDLPVKSEATANASAKAKTATARKKTTAKSGERTLSIKLLDVPEDIANTAQDLKKIIGQNDAKKLRQAARETLVRLTLQDVKSPLTSLDKMLFAYGCSCSESVLPGYSTLNEKHIAEIQDLLSQIQTYADDTTQVRPLNFLMLASPGAGKSHFIQCVAELFTL